MIQIRNVTKWFDQICALDKISLDIPEGIMFGLLGTNGAGKSTLLRLLAGILLPDSGEILVDRETAETGERAGTGSSGPSHVKPSHAKSFYANLSYTKSFHTKEKIFYLSDEPYYFPNADMEKMAEFYGTQYPGMDREGVAAMAETLNLDVRQPLRTFSKGMKRQAFLILALCAGTKYLLCDEVFDGLDPIVSEMMKHLFRQEMKQRKFTVIAASHKLYDLEDICDQIAILHRGGVVTAGDMRRQAQGVRKFQCVFQGAAGSDGLKRQLELQLKSQTDSQMDSQIEVIRFQTDGCFATLIVRGEKEPAERALRAEGAEFVREIPMTLEEIFIAEMEGKGYDIRKVLH